MGGVTLTPSRANELYIFREEARENIHGKFHLSRSYTCNLFLPIEPNDLKTLLLHSKSEMTTRHIFCLQSKESKWS